MAHQGIAIAKFIYDKHLRWASRTSTGFSTLRTGNSVMCLEGTSFVFPGGSFEYPKGPVVSTQLKNSSETGSFPQIGVKIKHYLNHLDGPMEVIVSS